MNERITMPILPVEAYTSREWFDREQERIFSRTWACAGFVEDISEPGQYLSVQAGLNNIFIVMGQDLGLRAFHNICRHRGTQLLRSAGKGGKVVACPYHDWVYDLEGHLISVPDRELQFPNVDMSGVSLKKASVDQWRGMVWVHPDENAGPVMDWLGEIEPRLGPHKVEELVEYPERRTEHRNGAPPVSGPSGSGASTRAAPAIRWPRGTSWPRTCMPASSNRSPSEAPTSSTAPRRKARPASGSIRSWCGHGWRAWTISRRSSDAARRFGSNQMNRQNMAGERTLAAMSFLSCVPGRGQR